MGGATRNRVQKKFKMRGYTLKVEALIETLSFLSRFQDAEEEALDLLLDELQHQSLKSSILDKEAVNRVVSLLLEAEAAVEDTPSATTSSSAALRVIDAFIIPNFCYDPVKKIFTEHTGRLPIHGDASAKAALYGDRFLLLFQRLSRDPHFSRPAFDSEISQFGSCEISPIQSLVGQTGKRWVMGLISQLEDGHFYLEDLTAAVEINLSNAVKTCGFPPLEDRDKSLGLFSGIDFFGCGKLTKEETLRLAELETRAVNDMFVILSDIWLDNEEVSIVLEKTMEKLQTVLDGYENVEVVPSLFVLMGNFCSHPCNLSFNSFFEVRLQFGKLGQMIGAHQLLKERSRFLFIPGPDDAGPSTVLPRCSLPKYITEELQEHIPNAIFASNPCSTSIGDTQKLINLSAFSSLLQLVATITHQSHLCPIPLSVQPIIWNYDHCLHLYPTPHTIVLGDKSEQKAFKESHALILVPSQSTALLLRIGLAQGKLNCQPCKTARNSHIY